MLKLHGFSASGYYNIAKLALLEKGAPFEEVLVYTSVGPKYRPDYLDMSPIGKVPCLETDQGYVTEARCIVDYVEHAVPGPSLYPTDLFARAKVMELTQFIELYLELPARRLIPNLFTRMAPDERVAGDVLTDLAKGTSGLAKLADFSRDYLVGDRLSVADISAVIHLPVVRSVIERVLGQDPLKGVPMLDSYLSRMDERPSVQQVRADQRESFPKFVEHLKSLQAG